MKILVLCALTIAVTLAEPPVNNRYLPPQQAFSGGYSPPSQTYGPPGSGFSSQRQTDAVFGSRPSSTYGAPARSRPTQYNAPRSQPTNQYLPPPSQYNPTYQAPSNKYGAPGPSASYQTPSIQYGAPSSQNYQAPSTQYGAPNSQSYQSPSTQYGAPNQYQAPTNTGFRNAPSQQYGAPGLSQPQNAYGSSGFRGNERSYLPPGRSGYSGDEDENAEPANYSFEYMVKDEPSGNDFGHRESRQGDRAEGLYYVLLPDGRKQTVEYEADQDGYKPRISYEDTDLVGGYNRNGQAGGYDRNSQSGYSNQGGPY